MGNPPNIRFKGFTDDWEQRKLGDWGDFYYGRSCPKWSVTEDATIPCIRYGELYTKFGAKIDRVYSYTNMPPENLRFSKGTEVLIPRVGEDPMDYNHCTWLSMKDVAIGEMISVFNTDNNPLFTATMFNATLQNEFAMRVEGGSVTNLYFEKLKNIDVSFPSIREQEMIAAYFENIDNLITLHQRKCDETKKLKKFMLQKMFPKKDAKKPEIRFVGFTNDWEQRKLGEIVERVTRKNQDLVSELPLTISAQYGLIDQNEFFDKRVASKDVSGYYLIYNGEFAYNKSTSSDAPWGAIKRLDRYENGVLSTLYIVFRIKNEDILNSD
jgi:type I restriction enzyme S subunit